MISVFKVRIFAWACIQLSLASLTFVIGYIAGNVYSPLNSIIDEFSSYSAPYLLFAASVVLFIILAAHWVNVRSRNVAIYMYGTAVAVVISATYSWFRVVEMLDNARQIPPVAVIEPSISCGLIYTICAIFMMTFTDVVVVQSKM